MMMYYQIVSDRTVTVEHKTPGWKEVLQMIAVERIDALAKRFEGHPPCQ